MASRVDFIADLDVLVAEQVVRPRLEDALAMLHDAARTLAPNCKVWVSQRDGLVRRSHVAADSQTVPDNLRFRVPKVNTGDDPNDLRVGTDMARYPRDTALPVGNRINCRCESVPSPTPLRASIHKSMVQVVGTRVFGEVYTEFPRAAESEFGTSEDAPASYMGGALRQVAARLQAGQTR